MYLNKLLKRTEEGKIKWRPICEYIQYYFGPDYIPHYVNATIRDYIRVMYNGSQEMYMDKSFFVIKDGYVLAMLNYKLDDKYGEPEEILELVGGIYNNPAKAIPEYIEGGFAKIQNAIIKYWQSKGNNNKLDISDRLEILGTFTEED